MAHGTLRYRAGRRGRVHTLARKLISVKLVFRHWIAMRRKTAQVFLIPLLVEAAGKPNFAFNGDYL
jgi:hypothetical protein